MSNLYLSFNGMRLQYTNLWDFIVCVHFVLGDDDRVSERKRTLNIHSVVRSYVCAQHEICEILLCATTQAPSSQM